jgi:hypothetical protein
MPMTLLMGLILPLLGIPNTDFIWRASHVPNSQT